MARGARLRNVRGLRGVDFTRSNRVTLNEFDNWADSFLKLGDYAADISMNGIQVQNSNPNGKLIKKVAFVLCK